MAIVMPDLATSKVEWIEKKSLPPVKKEVEPFGLISSSTIRVSKQISHFAADTKVAVGLLDNRYIVIQSSKKDSAVAVGVTKKAENAVKCPSIIRQLLEKGALQLQDRYAKFAAGYDEKKKAVVIDLEAPMKMQTAKKNPKK